MKFEMRFKVKTENVSTPMFRIFFPGYIGFSCPRLIAAAPPTLLTDNVTARREWALAAAGMVRSRPERRGCGKDAAFIVA